MSSQETSAIFAFDNSYARLPERFYARVHMMPVTAPRLVQLNEALARQLGLDPAQLASPAGVQILAGNSVALGSTPIAMAYAGHQFGGFSPQLGDGRAMLLGEVLDQGGVRRDIQLKGSGPTPFSRRGDGRAAIGPVLREYLISEYFGALGIPTTRSLAAVTTGEFVLREQPLPGAVLTRVASSHVRVGTFQYFAARGDMEGVKCLADYMIERHYPQSVGEPNRYLAFLEAVIQRQAALIAQWQLIGFIHGVMNTDNMSVVGETIDYGPCAFMDGFDPAQTYSSIDEMGRYAYGNQPRIAQWNLARLTETLLPLLGETDEARMEQAQAALNGFAAHFEAAYTEGMRRKLGLQRAMDGDLALGQELLAVMASVKADFTLTFRRLCEATAGSTADVLADAEATDHAAFEDWFGKWKSRIAQEGAIDDRTRQAAMRAVNPAYIPRNHIVEAVLAAAVANEDFAPFRDLLAVLLQPFEERPGREDYARPPRPEQVVLQTFCGT